MEAEVDDTGQESGSLVRNSSLSSMLDYVKNFIPGYQDDEHEEECQEKIGDKLKKKRMRSKRRSSPLNKKDYPSTLCTKDKTAATGHHRSVVRYIGSNIPIAPTKRAYFELLDNSRRAFVSSASNFLSANLDHVRQHVDQVKYRVVPTLADIGQLVWDDLNVFDEDEDSSEDDEDEDEIADEEEIQVVQTSSVVENEKDSSTKDTPKEKDGTKITELEDELAKLRAQIAMIVSASQPQPPAHQPTPVAVVPPIMSAPPAPPPPPPPPPPPSFKAPAPKVQIKKAPKKREGEDAAPSISDVLKGLSSVKLKSVANRSPGGTPMRDKKKASSDSNDPADIIARALREKFRNSRTCYESPEADSSHSPSSFSPSPRKHKKSPKVVSTMAKPVPRPRPKPRPRTQKKTSRTEDNAATMEKTKLF